MIAIGIIFLYLLLHIMGKDKTAVPIDVQLQKLIKKYGEDWGPLIYKGELKIGMTTKMVAEILGKPDSRVSDINEGGNTMKCVYEHKNEEGTLLSVQTLTFIDGVLKNINIKD